MELERRCLKTEIRLLDGNSRILAGRIPYNTNSAPLGSFVERIGSGAFGDSVNGDIRAFWNHQDESIPLGRSPRTMRLNDTPDGLDFEIDLPETTQGNDLLISFQRGDVDSVSFAFYLLADTWSDGGTVRTVTSAELVEISPVNYPAYPSASIGVRSLELAQRSLETWKKQQQPAKDWLTLLEIMARSAR